MTIFTGTKEELELWLAERDAIADAQIAAGQWRPLKEWIDQWKLDEYEVETMLALEALERWYERDIQYSFDIETKLFIASISDPDLSDFGDTPEQAKKNVLAMLYLYFEKEEVQQEAIVTEYEHERAIDKIVAGGSLDDLDEKEPGLKRS